MREIILKWFRQAYLEGRPGRVWTEFMTDDGQQYQTFTMPMLDTSSEESRIAFHGHLCRVIDQTGEPVICGVR